MRRPSLPLGRRTPLILAAMSVALLAYGILSSNNELIALGGIGLAATFVAFILPSIVLPRDRRD